jgi:hypothetical protein
VPLWALAFCNAEAREQCAMCMSVDHDTRACEDCDSPDKDKTPKSKISGRSGKSRGRDAAQPLRAPNRSPPHQTRTSECTHANSCYLSPHIQPTNAQTLSSLSRLNPPLSFPPFHNSLLHSSRPPFSLITTMTGIPIHPRPISVTEHQHPISLHLSTTRDSQHHQPPDPGRIGSTPARTHTPVVGVVPHQRPLQRVPHWM